MARSRVRKYGRNRLAEGKLPACAEMCSTKPLLAVTAMVADILRNRVVQQSGRVLKGLGTAYGTPNNRPPRPHPLEGTHELPLFETPAWPVAGHFGRLHWRHVVKARKHPTG